MTCECSVNEPCAGTIDVTDLCTVNQNKDMLAITESITSSEISVKPLKIQHRNKAGAVISQNERTVLGT